MENKEVEKVNYPKNKSKKEEREEKSRVYSSRILVLILGTVLILIFGSSFLYIKELKDMFEEKKAQSLQKENLFKSELLDCDKSLKEKESLISVLQEGSKSGQNPMQMIVRERTIGDGCYKKINGNENVHGIVREDFNNDPANIVILYTNDDLGISFDVPYNKNWGNEECVVLPYFSYKNPESWQVIFGQTTEARPFGFHTRQKRDKEDIFNEQKGSDNPDPNPRLEKIGEWEAIVYESYGMSTKKVYEIIGSKSNYIFSFHLVTDESKENLATNSAEIVKVIKSFKKIN